MEELNIKEMISYFISKLKLIILVTLIITLLGSAQFLFTNTKEYKVSISIFATRINNNLDGKKEEGDNNLIIPTYMELIKTRPILESTIESLDLNYTFEELLSKISTEQVNNTDILKLNVKSNESAEECLEIARHISNKFIEENNKTSKVATLSILEEMEFLKEDSKLDKIKNIILIFITGIFLSLIIVFAMYYFDNTIKSKEDVEELLKLKLLTLLPNIKFKEKLIAQIKSNVNILENFKIIKIFSSKNDNNSNHESILIISPSKEEGKSFVASNLAITYAKTNQKVLLIDGNIRDGKMNLLFKIENKNGLSEILAEKIALKNAVYKTDIPNLDFLNSGTSDFRSSELLSSNFDKFLKETKNLYDVIVIKSPSYELVSDGLIMSKYTDKTIIVAQHRKTDIRNLIKLKEDLMFVGSNILGVVINKYISLKHKYKDYYIE